MSALRVALAQIAPTLGRFDENLARHHALIDEARDRGAGLVVFPELGLTGYLLQDLAAEVAIRLDDPRLAGLAAETKDLSLIVSFVEESADHRLFIADSASDRIFSVKLDYHVNERVPLRNVPDQAGGNR